MKFKAEVDIMPVKDILDPTKMTLTKRWNRLVKTFSKADNGNYKFTLSECKTGYKRTINFKYFIYYTVLYEGPIFSKLSY